MRALPIARFMLISISLLALGSAFGPTKIYPKVFRVVANRLFYSLGSGRAAHLEALDNSGDMHDTRLTVGLRSRGFLQGISLNSLRQGYVPTLLILSLVIASPLPVRQRLIALVPALLLVQLFILAR